MAKFGTKHELNMELGRYVDRKPKKIHEKTPEQKINNHKKDLLRKHLVIKKINCSRK